MPLTRISMLEGKSPAFKAAIRRGVYEAMRETYDVPEKDRFIIVEELKAENFDFDRDYLGIERSDDFVVVQPVVSDTRGPEKKAALIASIAEKLGADPGLRLEDVFVVLVEVKRDNWSFGLGRAQYQEADRTKTGA